MNRDALRPEPVCRATGIEACNKNRATKKCNDHLGNFVRLYFVALGGVFKNFVRFQAIMVCGELGNLSL